MASCNDLKMIALARVKTSKILLDAGDWDGAAYMMACSLECALKSAICKTLRLTSYPDDRKSDEWFLTHRFDRLLRLSGLEDVFGPKGSSFYVWSQFTKEFSGEWPALRYDLNRQIQFDETKTKNLYNALIDQTTGSEGLITIIKIKKRW